MLGRFRTDAWRRRGWWLRIIGIALLLATVFVPLPAAWLAALIVPGLVIFLVGAAAWLARDEGPWLRRE